MISGPLFACVSTPSHRVRTVSASLACGTPPAPRARTLALLGRLRPAQQATPAELLDFIEREALYDQGGGLVDIGLLAAARLTPGARLWTLDRRLAALATRLGVAWAEPD
jgi:hypothetical protein